MAAGGRGRCKDCFGSILKLKPDIVQSNVNGDENGDENGDGESSSP